MRSELTQMDSQSSKPAENLLYSNPMPWAAHLFFSPRLRRTSDVYLWLAEMSVEQFDLQPRSWLRSETSHSRSEPKTMTVTTTFAKTLSLISSPSTSGRNCRQVAHGGGAVGKDYTQNTVAIGRR
jgi:hypothetical protein